MPKFRSKFEKTIAKLSDKKIKYESVKIPYVLEHNYTPDFTLPNGILIEAKGYLRPSDRKKMIAVKKQHPELDIRFLFQRAENTINKISKTTYSKWAEKNGFRWASGSHIPDEWLKE